MQLIKVILTFISAFQLVKGDIFTAISSGNVKKVEKELQSNPNELNKIGSGGQSPLMNAVLSGKTEVVRFLLQEGADVTIGEQDGYTPMVSKNLSSKLYNTFVIKLKLFLILSNIDVIAWCWFSRPSRNCSAIT